LWKKAKKRYENVEGPDLKWSTYEYDAFVYLGPGGTDLSSIKTGAMDADNIDMDTSRASAKLGMKGMKRLKLDVDVPVQKESKVHAQLAIATQLESHTRVASVRLLL
jgi:hypothetical protein